MARLYPTLLVVPLLAACASTSPQGPPGDVFYLHGIDSDYSVRASELHTEKFEALVQDLPGALLAGNEEFTVAASVFRRGDNVTLDMIVANHSSQELRLNRADVYIFDYMGNRLASLDDWSDGQNYGLRSLVKQGDEYTYFDQPQEMPRKYGQEGQSAGTTNKPAGSQVSPANPDTRSSLEDDSTELDMLTSPIKVRRFNAVAPQILVVKPGEKKPYWAYFKSKDMVFPVTAIVRLEGKRLIFRFESPGKAPSSAPSSAAGSATSKRPS
ncbi:MAG TPA: hypothetical protein VKA63_03610 [Candidatus Krumholzibacteria bacterium]|nr:hypothetical protein [Candidatus Krumholzibacteria bacterium]